MTDKNKMLLPRSITSKFEARLSFYKSRQLIKVLYRGVDLRTAFDVFNLIPGINTIEQFGEDIFYFGQKARYHWKDRMHSSINLDDTSAKAFNFVFKRMKSIALDPRRGSTSYRTKNAKALAYFADTKNKNHFVHEMMSLKQAERKRQRNYYFRIIHQLGEFIYKDTSHFLSSSVDLSEAQKFSHKELIITFWDLNFANLQLQSTKVPPLIGKPYKTQREVSVLAAIFPHYIYSFTYQDTTYYNPALLHGSNYDAMILNGFDIDQSDFLEKLKVKTKYRSAAKSNGMTISEIGQ